jgi:acyl-CoA synthetase (AMP-forming)/AMP-acid ligase II
VTLSGTGAVTGIGETAYTRSAETCHAALAGYKQPKGIHSPLESLPRSTTGKIQRHELAEGQLPLEEMT